MNSASCEHVREHKLIKDGDSLLLYFPEDHSVLRLAGYGSGAQAVQATLRVRGTGSRSINQAAVAAAKYYDGSSLAINVNLTGECNLACVYCFARGGAYGRFFTHTTGDYENRLFEFIGANVLPNRKVRFEFFGGEPLLDPMTIERICRRSKDFSVINDVRFSYRVSTNLTVLPPSILDLLGEYGFVVSVSVDGTRETHDANRPFKDGRGSFDVIMQNCSRVRRLGDRVTLVARMTARDGQFDWLEAVETLWERDLFDYFQVLPAFVDGRSLTPMSPLQFAGVRRHVVRLLAAYPSFFEQSRRFKGLLEWERIADILVKQKVALAHCSAGRTYFTLSGDKSISPCHRLAGQAAYALRNAGVDAVRPESPWKDSVGSFPKCCKCWARYICAGGCKQENLLTTGAATAASPMRCSFEKTVIAAIIRLIARGGDYAQRDRSQLDELFVSCGRPVVPTSPGRDTAEFANTE